ncbi:MAG TPA: mechanosensitive ion channel [Saprospiraceae bacterium]|nr:mechanosensitive ion channel [Saprospiraceae bacterium]
MQAYEIKLLETALILGAFLVARLILSKFFLRVNRIFPAQKNRIDGFRKILNLILGAVSTVLVFIVWGVDQKELLLFVSSFLTVLGIAFFAQWSLLSNITSSLILFVNHPAKVGDTIMILDKDFSAQGLIREIGIFFIHIETTPGETITVPTSLFLQKMVKIVEQSDASKASSKE